jgi:SAM-dependent methyltransferase
MNEELRIRRTRTFDEIAELYDRARRECPDHVFSDLFAQTGIEPSRADVLEIGCGTGQATLPLARRGFRVLCVEMGANLARIPRRKLAEFPRVTVVNARFEDWAAGNVSFDIVFAATSRHWLDPHLRYAKAAAALRPGGVLAFTTGGHAFPPGLDPFFIELRSCYEAIGEARMPWPPPTPEDICDARDEIERSGFFERVRVIRRIWTQEFTADEYVAMMSTASDHRLIEPEKRAAVRRNAPSYSRTARSAYPQTQSYDSARRPQEGIESRASGGSADPTQPSLTPLSHALRMARRIREVPGFLRWSPKFGDQCFQGSPDKPDGRLWTRAAVIASSAVAAAAARSE